MKKKLLCLLLAVLAFTGLLGGCGKKDPADQVIRFDLESKVSLLDPQFSTDSSAQTIIYNIFEGLVTQDSNGGLHPAAAKNYTVSADGLTYTFYLHENGIWSDGSPLTADDFVFAFQRLFNPAMVSSFASDFSCIQNGKKILNGEMDLSSLGVKAVGDYQLVIRLEEPNPFFITLLASSAAMPCNQAFFEDSKGRYGLNKEFVLSNGPFQLRAWGDEVIAIRRSGNYLTGDAAIPAGVQFYIGRSNPENLLFTGDTDAAKIQFSSLNEAHKSKLSVAEFEDTVWTLIFNQTVNDPEFPPQLSYNSLRLALCSALNRQLFSNSLTGDLKLTTSLIPGAVHLQGKPYSEAVASAADLYDPQMAKNYRNSFYETAGVSKPDSISILVLDTGNQAFLTGFIQQAWQKELSIFVNVEPLPEKEFWARLSKRDYTAAVLPLKLDQDAPQSILGRFASTSTQNYTGYSNEAYDNVLRQAATAKSFSQMTAAFADCEDLLTRNGVAVPLYTQTSYYAAAPEITGIDFSPFSGRVFFKNAVKSE